MSRSRNRSSGSVFSIAVVCTGNICRSPLAEQVLRARLTEARLSGQVEVASAGLAAVVGAPMDEIPAEISTRLGGDPTQHRGQQLNAAIVGSSDLVLTMTREQRDSVVQLFPRATHQSFTLTEFTALLALTSKQGSQEQAAEPSLVSRLRLHTNALARGRNRVRLGDGDDIQDPYRQSRAVHEIVGQQIALACSQIAHNIAAWAEETALRS